MTRLILSLVLASLGAACAPDRSAPVAPTRVNPLMITGVVREVTPEGTKPVQGAEVSAQWFDAPIVTTVSDAQGRYLLCGLDEDPRALVESVWARKPGYRDVVRALTLSGRNAVLEIELARR